VSFDYWSRVPTFAKPITFKTPKVQFVTCCFKNCFVVFLFIFCVNTVYETDCCNVSLQFETVKNVLKLMSKPSLAEQAGRMAIENCIVVIVVSLAAVSTLT